MVPVWWLLYFQHNPNLISLPLSVFSSQGRICRKSGKSKKAFSRKEAEATFKSLVKTHEKYGWVSPPVSDGWAPSRRPSDPCASRTKTQLALTRKTTHHANSTISHLHLLLIHLRVFFVFFCLFVCFFVGFVCPCNSFFSSSPPKLSESRHAGFIVTPPTRSVFRSPPSRPGRFFPLFRKDLRGRCVCVCVCVCVLLRVCIFVTPSDIAWECVRVHRSVRYCRWIFFFSFPDAHPCTCSEINRTVWTFPPTWKTTEWRRLIPLSCHRHPPLFYLQPPRSLPLLSTGLASLPTVSLCSCRVIYI